MPRLDRLSDADLNRLNELLDWQCFTVDGNGRRFGNAAWRGKRTTPQPVPDDRIVRLDERVGLDGRTVVEVGCFEGVHTVGLAQLGADVIATDARIENVVKTMVRCGWYGVAARTRLWDVERERGLAELACDVVHHVGVLYHLADPVAHLLDVARMTRVALMLDTHVAPDEVPLDSYEVAGVDYRYLRYREHGRDDVFSGMQDHAKWLPLEVLVALLEAAGFDEVDVAEHREERNGPRVLIFASKRGS